MFLLCFVCFCVSCLQTHHRDSSGAAEKRGSFDRGMFSSRSVDVTEVQGNVIWVVDKRDLEDRLPHLVRNQCISKIPGMMEMCKKVPFGRALQRVANLFPEEYAFWPQTWIMPDDSEQLERLLAGKKVRIGEVSGWRRKGHQCAGPTPWDPRVTSKRAGVVFYGHGLNCKFIAECLFTVNSLHRHQHLKRF